MAAGWVAAAGVAAVCIVYFSEIQDTARALVGIAAPGGVAAGCRSGSPGAPSRQPHGRAAAPTPRATTTPAPRSTADAINVMVDTGASMVALTYEDARAIGIFVRDSDFTMRVSTANGYARVAPVTLDRVSIGDITVRNVRGAVMEAGQARHHAARHVVPGPPAARRHARGTLVLQE